MTVDELIRGLRDRRSDSAVRAAATEIVHRLESYSLGSNVVWEGTAEDLLAADVDIVMNPETESVEITRK